MYGYIYRITDLTNGKCYIGQHKYDKPMLDPKYHGSGKIIKQIYKKRPDTLMEEILMICATLDEANYFEQYFIEHMSTMVPYGYNFQKGGDCHEGQIPWNKGLTKEICPELSKKHTDEWKQKQSAVMKGKHHTEETKQKISKTLKERGYKHTDEWKSKMKGRTPWNKGIPASEEAKRKNREAHKNRKGYDCYNYIHIDQDLLYKLYIVEQKTCKELSIILGIKLSTVYKKLYDYGIKKPNKYKNYN